ncbi:hypothetical protein LIP_1791 [Limnochorda pilosa]|uniref:Uncharacterized protein n=1 Tax=Limnochorda pilosa TaxID=1555112 RepID=A0A0K2SKL1_LIMPI|nr:hypothetical protein LIP_1791 [Limnochorda pilosa]
MVWRITLSMGWVASAMLPASERIEGWSHTHSMNEPRPQYAAQPYGNSSLPVSGPDRHPGRLPDRHPALEQGQGRTPDAPRDAAQEGTLGRIPRPHLHLALDGPHLLHQLPEAAARAPSPGPRPGDRACPRAPGQPRGQPETDRPQEEPETDGVSAGR